MNYDTLMYLHLVSVIPCIFLGAYGLFGKKGTAIHRRLGKSLHATYVIHGNN